VAEAANQTLAHRFAALFVGPAAIAKLSNYKSHTRLPAFNLATSSLRHLTKWFDRLSGQPVGSFPPILIVAAQPLSGIPGGSGSAPPHDNRRKKPRSAKRAATTVILDPLLSERAEDLAEKIVLLPEHGDLLERAGHRDGEILPLADGMVPGADFYVACGSAHPVEYIEIKSVSGNPPFEVGFTRAEYPRGCECYRLGIHYRLLLVDVATGQFYEVPDFAPDFARFQLAVVVRFVIKVL
jgi:hypothetical protein